MQIEATFKLQLVPVSDTKTFPTDFLNQLVVFSGYSFFSFLFV